MREARQQYLRSAARAGREPDFSSAGSSTSGLEECVRFSEALLQIRLKQTQRQLESVGDDLLTSAAFDPDSSGALNALVSAVPRCCGSCGSVEHTACCWPQVQALPCCPPALRFAAADLEAGSWTGSSQALQGLTQVGFWGDQSTAAIDQVT